MKKVADMVAAANAVVDHLPGAEALALAKRDDVQFVDLRDIRELTRDGRIPGAAHCPRGMLEFWLDPESPYAKPMFQQDKLFVFFCASGWRSALATRTAQDMGLPRVTHISDGFAGWKSAGGAVEHPEKSG